MPTLEHLSPSMAHELAEFWTASFPLHPLTDYLLAERVFGPPDASPENSLCYLDKNRNLIALSLLVPPGPEDGETGRRIAGLRWFGVHPDHRGGGLGTALLKESCERLKSQGADAVDFLSTPPFYIQPGVDVRLTSLIAWLLHHGFEHDRTNFNMSLDLETFQPPPEEQIFAPDADGYIVRRATPGDREAFADYALRDWTAGWRDESSQGLYHDPVSLFLSLEQPGGGIVGFASYETNQCLGCFGPTGVSPAHRGKGLAKRLLWATLADMQSLGRKHCEIGWVGPVDFYHRACGATLGPVFWSMRKQL